MRMSNSLDPCQAQHLAGPGPEVIKKIMLNSTEYKISTAHKN